MCNLNSVYIKQEYQNTPKFYENTFEQFEVDTAKIADVLNQRKTEIYWRDGVVCQSHSEWRYDFIASVTT